jgi:hypothetical protein
LTGFAKLISYIFQPLLMPTMVFYTLLFHLGSSSNLTDKGRWTVLWLIFLTTCLIPMVTVIMFRLTKVIKDLQMQDRRDRFIPFVFITVFYLVVAYLILGQEWMNVIMRVAFKAITAVVVLTNLITFRWKISAHAAGVAGWLGFIVAFAVENLPGSTLFYPLLIAVFLNGLVYWSRLYLNAHKPAEIWAGAFMGFSICYSAISFFL